MRSSAIAMQIYARPLNMTGFSCIPIGTSEMPSPYGCMARRSSIWRHTQKHLKYTHTPPNQKGASHRGVGVGVGVAHCDIGFFLWYNVDLYCGFSAPRARDKVVLRQFDVQSPSSSLSIVFVPSLSRSQFLLEDDDVVIVGRCLRRLTRRFLPCCIYLGHLCRSCGCFAPTRTPQQPHGCGETHTKETTGFLRGILGSTISSE